MPPLCSTFGLVAVTWAASADKHRIPHEDAIHAIANAHYVEIEFDEPKLEGKVRPALYIGSPRQLGGICWRSW